MDCSRRAMPMKTGVRRHTRLAIATSMVTLMIVAAMLLRTRRVVAFGQALAYDVSGGTIEGIVRTPTIASVLAMTVLCVVMATSVKCVVEGLWALYRLRTDMRDAVIASVMVGACSVLVLLSFSMMPSMPTSAWLGAIVVTLVGAAIYFVVPNGDELSVVPAYRRHAHDVRAIGDVMDGVAGVIVRTKGERRQAIGMLADALGRDGQRLVVGHETSATIGWDSTHIGANNAGRAHRSHYDD